MFNHPWIAPDLNELSNTSVAAARLAKYLHWKGQLYLVGREFLGKLVYRRNKFKLWRGKGKNNTGKYGLNQENNFGLILELIGDNRMLLTGDCEYSMFPSRLGFSPKRYGYLVVPHHCSRMPLYPLVKRRRRYRGYAFISAGENTYTPKHPVQNHINKLKSRNYMTVKTDGSWYIRIVSLNGNPVYVRNC